MASNDLLSIIIPAHNEALYIGDCLDSLLQQDERAEQTEIIVVANGCHDATVSVARAREKAFALRDWRLSVLDLSDGNKVSALNAGDREAIGSWRLYLDADIRCDPQLIRQMREVLARPEAVFVTGTLRLVPARSWITRRYGDFWMQLPFVRGGSVAVGLYAVNAPGRARWGQFPSIIADDGFARLQFGPEERVEVPATYSWPLVEGFSALVRVRRRQDSGTTELFQHFPELAANEAKPQLTAGWLFGALWRKPLSGLVYFMVSLAVRSRRATGEWARGR